MGSYRRIPMISQIEDCRNVSVLNEEHLWWFINCNHRILHFFGNITRIHGKNLVQQDDVEGQRYEETTWQELIDEVIDGGIKARRTRCWKYIIKLSFVEGSRDDIKNRAHLAHTYLTTFYNRERNPARPLSVYYIDHVIFQPDPTQGHQALPPQQFFTFK